MNERIQALADEAEDYADGIVDQGGEFHPAYTRKLAELIVRECAEVIDAQKPVWQNTDVPAEIALDMAAKNIKAYFGVEE